MESTTPPPADQPPYAPPAPSPQRSGSDGFFDAMRRTGIVRTQDRWIGGVAGGFAQRFGIDPLLVRGILGVTVIFGGAGLIIYGLAWALLPEQADGRIHLQETIRGRFDAGLLGAIGMFIIGISRGDNGFGWWGNSDWLSGLLWFAAVVTLIALVIAAANQRGRRRPPAGAQGPWTGDPRGPWTAAPAAPGAPAHPASSGPQAPTTTYAPPPPPPNAYAGTYSGPPPSGYPARPTGAYPGPGGYAGPPASSLPTPPLVPPRPVKPRVQGPGAAAIRAVVGLSLVALAALLIIDRVDGGLNPSVGIMAAGIAIVLAGVGILIAGLRGRKSGTLGFLAITGVVLAVPASLFSTAEWNSSPDNIRFIVSDGTWEPSTPAEAREGLAVAVGDVNVDLTQFATAGGVVRVPLSLGAGDLTVTVPRDTAISANVQLSAGDISWQVDDRRQISGVSGSRSYDFASNEVTAGASPEIELQIESGAGAVRVVEVDR